MKMKWIAAVALLLAFTASGPIRADDGDKEKAKIEKKEKERAEQAAKEAKEAKEKAEKEKGEKVAAKEQKEECGSVFTRFWVHTVGGTIGNGLKHGAHKIAQAFD